MAAKTQTTQAKPLTPGDLEIKVIHDELKLVGDYVEGRGFVDPELDALLKHYCELDKIDASRMDASGLPVWLLEWQKRVTATTSWNDGTQGRAGVAEAYLRWYFRSLCKKHDVSYAEAADEFFAELFKSTTNGRGDDFSKGKTWEPQPAPQSAPGPGTRRPADPHEPTPQFDHTHALPLKKAPPKTTGDGSKSGTGASGSKGEASGGKPGGQSTGAQSDGSGEKRESPLFKPPPPKNELEQRMRAAWHSARIEICNGQEKYGDGVWTTGPNTGPLIDPYQRAADAPVGPGALAWCGIFQAWNYRQAGIKADEVIAKKFQITDRPGKRVMTFWSTLRLVYYWQQAKSPNLKFPWEKFGAWKRDDCAKWLKEKFNAYAPVPGDLLILDTYKPLAHVGMVGGYDPDTFTLITYEGNCGDKAAAHQWDLAEPTKHGFFRMNYIGRMLESDFGDPGEVQPEGPSPDPKVLGATSATGRYGG